MTYVIDKNSLPPLWPTTTQSSEFWEWLGRTIATYSFLEYVLKKAIFAFSSQTLVAEHEAEQEVKQWEEFLYSTFTSPLAHLVDGYKKIVDDTPGTKINNFDVLIKELKESVPIRNLLCHASWISTDLNNKATPFYLDKREGLCGQEIDIQFLQQTHRAVSNLAVSVINSVTYMGWKFP